MDSHPESSLTKWQDFERHVADIFRKLGAQVERDVALAGSQIDVLVRESGSAGSIIITAVECKAYTRPVGIDVVNSYSGLSYLLRQRGLIHRAAIVSAAGFTRAARDAAASHAVELLEIADLEQRVPQSSRSTSPASPIEAAEIEAKRASEKRAFVLMPFAPEFEDVYILGIREVAEKVGFVVERADSVEHNGEIIEVVRQKIRTADVVIADTTGRNANVYYELGYSHALERPTVLIARKGETLPFDVQSLNFILYETIVDLRDRLEKRLRHMLSA